MKINARSSRIALSTGILSILCISLTWAEDNWYTPYNAPRTQRNNTFAFTHSPQVIFEGNDRYKITFAVKGYCDVTVSLVDKNNHIVRHLASGVLGKNAPAPFQKNALQQIVYWNGQDDLGDYVKEPNALRVNVALGLKPVFDKRLGGSSPYHLPGFPWGIAIGPKGAYVFIKGEGKNGKLTVRAFDHDGTYQRTLLPPPANFPNKKMEGMGAIEYEPGKFAYHAPKIDNTSSKGGFVLPAVNGISAADSQLAIIGDKILYCNQGVKRLVKGSQSKIFYIHTDGATTAEGLKGIPFIHQGRHYNPRLAASVDGQWLYFVGLATKANRNAPVVMKRSMNPKDKAKPFVGKKGGRDGYSVGSGNDAFNNPTGIDCDAQGRVYVADQHNNRIQIFSSEGQHVKTLKIERPKLVRVHRKTGAIFVNHYARLQGKAIPRLTKFTSFSKLVKEYHVDHFPAAVLTLDSYTSKTRIWAAGERNSYHSTGGSTASGPGLTIWEEQGKGLKKLRDFDAEGRKAAGKSYFGRFSGAGSKSDKLVCDPVREQAYYRNKIIFDLKTGNVIGTFQGGPMADDIAFDKHGYLHAHLNAGGGVSTARSGVLRLDPSQVKRVTIRNRLDKVDLRYPEVPYDYGIQKRGVGIGIVPVRDQGGGKHFLNGIGVNMAGDIAESCRIVNAPKFQKNAAFTFGSGLNSGNSQGPSTYAYTLRSIEAEEKNGNSAYAISRRPGVPLTGGTIWTWNRHGELLQECAVTCGGTTNGSAIDEDRKVTFAIGRYGYTRMVAGKPFLYGRGGLFGVNDPKTKQHPYTGSLIKTNGKLCVFKKLGAPIQMTESDRPKRKADLGNAGQVGRNNFNGGQIWVENAEWLYAGASPIISHGCECPTSRFHLDWFKRTFVSESYRHSIGVLDTAGNMIMHLGQYGNFDSSSGPKSKVPLDGDGIGVFIPRFISGTDTYLAFHDWGERIVVLKIDYHTQQSIAIKMK